ncbi:MAG: hypothetical protein IT347_12580 [Candidatus Eisenbacteria bacterium]|nr:hypothetical protein [Candidatus Eisenbacteria bacterium]
MNDRPKPPTSVSRRRFVAVMAAGSAALLARPVAAAAAAAPARARAAAGAQAAAAMTPAQRREYERQKSATLDTLKVIRGHAMPPGTEMASVFRARRGAKRER